jgi:hypothetical protein
MLEAVSDVRKLGDCPVSPWRIFSATNGLEVASIASIATVTRHAQLRVAEEASE